MLKRVLHTAQQIVVHEETHTESVIENTVNAPANVTVKADGWQGSTTGAQLLNLPDYEDDECIISNGIITIKDAKYGRNLFVPVDIDLPKGTYTFGLVTDAFENTSSEYQIQFSLFRSNSIYDNILSTGWRGISWSENGKRTTTLEIDEHASFFNIDIINKTGIYDNFRFYVMLNEGSTALSWESYTGNAPSPSPAYPQDIISTSGVLKSTNNAWNGDKLRESQITIPELRAIPGTDIRDELVVYPDGSGKIVRKAWKIKLVSDGLSQNWIRDTGVSYKIDNYTGRNIGSTIYDSGEPYNNQICTHMVNTNSRAILVGRNFYIEFYVRDGYKSLPTLDDVKSMIDNDDVYLLYALKTPIEEPLTAEQISILRTAQHHTEIIWEGLDEHLKPEVEVTAKHIGR